MWYLLWKMAGHIIRNILLKREVSNYTDLYRLDY